MIKLEQIITENPVPRIKQFSPKGFPELRLRLIEGGTFEMGGKIDYWEDPSWKEKRKHLITIPHQVELSDFYVSELISQEVWKQVTDGLVSQRWGANDEIQRADYEEATEFCRILSAKTNIPFRIISEAEWEFLAKTDQQNFTVNENEWCFDFYGIEYYDFCRKLGKVKDPLGPSENDYPNDPYRGPARSCRVLFQSIDMVIPSKIYRSWSYVELSPGSTHVGSGRFRIVYSTAGTTNELQFEEIVPEYKFYVEDLDGFVIGKTVTMKESINLFLELHPNFDIDSIKTFIYEIK